MCSFEYLPLRLGMCKHVSKSCQIYTYVLHCLTRSNSTPSTLQKSVKCQINSWVWLEAHAPMHWFFTYRIDCCSRIAHIRSATRPVPLTTTMGKPPSIASKTFCRETGPPPTAAQRINVFHQNSGRWSATANNKQPPNNTREPTTNSRQPQARAREEQPH